MPVVAVREISKTFSTVRAVDRVSAEFYPGEIHALLGENGAGKSTLMHLLAGLYRPDAGEIRIDGQTRVFSSPRAARAAGIAMVHQHFMLVPPLTVAENILFALPGSRWDVVRRNQLAEQVQALAGQYGITVEDPHALVSLLPVGAQQRVEILKALAANARVLILDEPTAVLTPHEVESLFHTLRDLKRAGYLILLITHKIPEVLAISDRLSVLRHGKLVATRETSSCSAEELASLMIGEILSHSVLPWASAGRRGSGSKQSASPLLALENVCVHGEGGRMRLRHVSLQVNRGEVIGIAGVDGNGQTELVAVLIGLRVPDQGTLWLRGQQLIAPTPASLRAAGVSLIPQDRRQEGLALSLTIEENLLLSTHLLETLTPGFLLPPSTVRRFATEQVDRFTIHAPSPTQPVSALSGGNQQRVVIARELAFDPQLIVAANPSRGLDVGATHYVHQVLRERCQRGAGVVLISTDLDEVLALSDRVYTLYHGHLSGPIEPTAGRAQIGRMMTGAWVPP
ncbi:MAG TPA: ABC transporter ATP-binding protein [Candidatus Binatia bacterium]|nr:ABC transporter ATP-binding protein [Candidatus Binatia bacterium]